jgi:iron complex transport system ATP-binding protein
MKTPLIAATGLSAKAGATTLLNNVSLSVDAGQLVAIVGPNGAGKSTLLDTLAGDRLPASGSVELGGLEVGAASPQDLARVRGFLGQHIATEIPFTVRDVVAMGRYARHSSPDNSALEDDSAVAAAMSATDVTHLADRVVATLSGGEEQRVHVARVLAQDTQIVLLDEPTNSLDISHQALVMTSVRSVATNGGAAVVVLHDLNLAALFADQLVMLSNGESAAVGSPREVLTEDTVSTVYGHSVRVIDHPYYDAPLVLAPGPGADAGNGPM